MKQIDHRIFPGVGLVLHEFCTGVITKVYQHQETKEMCVEVKAQGDELMHLSLAYVERLLS